MENITQTIKRTAYIQTQNSGGSWDDCEHISWKELKEDEDFDGVLWTSKHVREVIDKEFGDKLI